MMEEEKREREADSIDDDSTKFHLYLLGIPLPRPLMALFMAPGGALGPG